MRAAEGQKRSYVEMILSSEVEVKLRCDEEWKKEWRIRGAEWSKAGIGGRGDQW